MISIGANGNRKAYGIKHYNLDTEVELIKLSPIKLAMGTTAFIIENSKHYMVNGSHEWKEVNPKGNNPGGGDIPDIDEEVIYDGGGVDDSTTGDDTIYEGGGV